MPARAARRYARAAATARQRCPTRRPRQRCTATPEIVTRSLELGARRSTATARPARLLDRARPGLPRRPRATRRPRGRLPAAASTRRGSARAASAVGKARPMAGSRCRAHRVWRPRTRGADGACRASTGHRHGRRLVLQRAVCRRPVTAIFATEPARIPQRARVDSRHQHAPEARCASSWLSPRVLYRLSRRLQEVDEDTAPTRRAVVKCRRRPSSAPIRCYGEGGVQRGGLRCISARARSAPRCRRRRSRGGARPHGTKPVQVKWGAGRGVLASRGSPPVHVGQLGTLI